jgi:uncharacterized membrane protein
MADVFTGYHQVTYWKLAKHLAAALCAGPVNMQK